MATSLPTAATKVHLDESSDDPRQARTELASLVDKLNTLLTALGTSARTSYGNGLEVVTQSTGTPDTLQVKIQTGLGIARESAGLRMDVSNLTSETVVSGDYIPMYDVSASTHRRTTAGAIAAIASAGALNAGLVMAYAGSSVPSGWLSCDGSAVSRTTYSGLFTAISTTWGVGDGSTTFNLPDMRGRTPIGTGTGSGLTARTLGQTGGTETHTLSTGELPSHNHKLETNLNTGPDGGLDVLQVAGIAANDFLNTFGTGDNTPHNNMQPWAAMTWIIKT